MNKKPEFYSLDKILKHNALYNIIFGKRSNGKTYAVQMKIINDYVKYGHQGAIIRRWEEDFRGKRGKATFKGILENDEISKATNGQWNDIYYYSGRWYFAKYDEELDRVVKSEEPFCYAFSLTTWEHDKSTSYPRVTNILFDEFLTRTTYLPDEFMIFMNVLSTIIRQRDNVIIFMLGNTINRFCPYFNEMKLTNVPKMKQGTIEVYTYVNNHELKVAVEFCGQGTSKETRLASDKYFGFENDKLQMITQGLWEIAMYPHLPFKYSSKEVKLLYYIMFEGETLQAEIIKHDHKWITFIHPWTRDIPNPDKDIVYHTGYDPRYNWKRKITSPKDSTDRWISWFFNNDKVFYATNETGEVVRNYLVWCRTDKGII